MRYTIFAVGMLVGWIPIVIAFFATMPPRRAAVFAVVGGWLFLPPIALPVTGLPDFSKITAATLGILIGTAIFQPSRITQFRPRWYDIPMLLWCWCPMASSIANDLGPYDGFSESLVAIFRWGLAYFIGRIYFNSLEGLRELCNGIVAGGLIYVPLCLFEIRMSPQIMMKTYGMGSWQGMRLGGYRPTVFFGTGLELGLWMTVVCLVAWSMWRAGAFKKTWKLPIIGAVPFGMVLLPTLMVTTVLCRSSGALALLLIGMATIWCATRLRTSLPLWGIIAVACLYVCVRVPNLWAGENLVEMSASILDAERAHSLNFRFQCENQLIARALQQPIFGWGGWGRNTAYLARNEEGSFAFQAATDGLWVITLGINGYVGLTLLYTVILLPVILMIRRFPVSTWNTPAVAPAVACGTILALYLIDCLLNGFVNLIYIVMCGGLISTMPAPSIAGRAKPRDQDEKESIKAIEAGDSPTLERMATAAARLRRAESYIQVARSLSAEGQPEAAVAARRHALDLLREAWVLNPEDMAIRRRWCDCANDLAWSLANHADPRSRNPDEAVDLARRTVAALPSEGTYWNTLGAAQVRAGDYRDAVGSIERSIELCGGTGFDYGFLAMANAKLGDRDQAEHWLAQALEWTAAERPGHGELTRLCEEARGILASAPASPAITS